MKERDFTVIDENRVCEIPAIIDGGAVRLSPARLPAALGWELKPQGLCKGERCVPLSGRKDLVSEQGIDLALLSTLLSRPLAIDVEENVAVFGASAVDRSARLASLEAPDFALPDLEGRIHRLSDSRGKKVLLIAYASW